MSINNENKKIRSLYYFSVGIVYLILIALGQRFLFSESSEACKGSIIFLLICLKLVTLPIILISWLYYQDKQFANKPYSKMRFGFVFLPACLCVASFLYFFILPFIVMLFQN